jgi:hypothetical protein
MAANSGSPRDSLTAVIEPLIGHPATILQEIAHP